MTEKDDFDVSLSLSEKSDAEKVILVHQQESVTLPYAQSQRHVSVDNVSDVTAIKAPVRTAKELYSERGVFDHDYQMKDLKTSMGEEISIKRKRKLNSAECELFLKVLKNLKRLFQQETAETASLLLEMVLKYYNMQSDGNAKESTAKVAGLVLPKDLNNGNNEPCTTQQTDFQMVKKDESMNKGGAVKLLTRNLLRAHLLKNGDDEVAGSLHRNGETTNPERSIKVTVLRPNSSLMPVDIWGEIVSTEKGRNWSLLKNGDNKIADSLHRKGETTNPERSTKVTVLRPDSSWMPVEIAKPKPNDSDDNPERSTKVTVLRPDSLWVPVDIAKPKPNDFDELISDSDTDSAQESSIEDQPMTHSLHTTEPKLPKDIMNPNLLNHPLQVDLTLKHNQRAKETVHIRRYRPSSTAIPTSILEKNKFICKICQLTFIHSAEYKDHLFTHSGEKPHQCQVCPLSFYKSETLTEHYNRYHRGMKYSCKVKFTRKKYKYSCKQCFKTYETENELEEHTLNCHHKSRLCDICGASFVTQDSFKRHCLTHLGKLVKCNICPKGFYTLQQLQHHQRLVHFREKCVCEICGDEVKDLKQHMFTVHTDTKPYECEDCGCTFKQRKTKKHLCKHKKMPKPFNCDLCPSGFSRRRALNAHYRIHTGERPFKCDVCGESFVFSYDLKIHNKVHISGKEIFKCNLCDKSFTTRIGAKVHKGLNRCRFKGARDMLPHLSTIPSQLSISSPTDDMLDQLTWVESSDGPLWQ